MNDKDWYSMTISLTTESARQLADANAEAARKQSATISTRIVLQPFMWRQHTIPEELSNFDWNKVQSIVCKDAIPVGVLSLPRLRELTVIGPVGTDEIDWPTYQNDSPAEQLRYIPMIEGTAVSVAMLAGLHTLYVRYFKLDSLLGVNRLVRLRRFIIDDCISLLGFPDKLTELTELVELRLTDCRIRALPDDIGRMTGLRVLCIERNWITQLPDSMVAMTNLRVLNLKNNYLSYTTNWHLPANLRVLDLSGNSLTNVPNRITELVELRDLGLAWCRLEQVTPDIDRLTKLVRLRLADNMIRQIHGIGGLPYRFFQMANLRVLDISGNDFDARSFDQFVSMNLDHLIVSGHREDDLRGMALRVTSVAAGKSYDHEDMFNLADFVDSEQDSGQRVRADVVP